MKKKTVKLCMAISIVTVAAGGFCIFGAAYLGKPIWGAAGVAIVVANIVNYFYFKSLL